MLAWLFTGFMVVILTFSFGLVIYRLPLLRARNELDSWVSREAAFLVNNWILLFSAFFVLFATMFPTLSEAVTGERLTVGRAVLQQVDAADRPHPAVPDRRRTAARVAEVDARQPARLSSCGRSSSAWSPAASLAALGVRVWASGAVLRALRLRRRHDRAGVLARRATSGAKNTGTDLLTAIIGLVGRNKRRYGGYIVHVGIVLMFLGFAGNGYKRDEQVLLKPGQQATVGAVHGPQRRRQGDRRRPEADDHRRTSRCSRTASRSTRCTRRSGPSASTRRSRRPRWRFAARSAEDLYVVLAGVRPGGRRRRACRSSSTRWSTGSGSASACWRSAPASRCCRSARIAFALAKMPAASAAATTLALLLLALAADAAPVLRAQHDRRARERSRRSTPRSAAREADAARDRLHVRHCGTSASLSAASDPCGIAAKMRERARRRSIESGQDARRDHPVRTSRSTAARSRSARRSTRASTAWRGCFRTSLGATGVVAVGFAAVKWSRTAGRTHAAAPPDAADPALDERLDDELRNLD